MTCETRAAYDVGDLADTLNAERDEAILHCKKKLDETLGGVTRESVRRDIGNYVFKGLLNGDINEPDFSKAMSIAYAAAWFFDTFSRKIVQLSDGRCAYFAPSPENQKRGKTNSESWAIYSVHAVTHGGKFVKKGADVEPYRERVWSPEKTRSMAFIDNALTSEVCYPETNDKKPQKDSIIFLGKDAEGKPMRVVTRLDEYGNIDADLTEVTVMMAGEGGNPKMPSKQPMNLAQSVNTIVQHEKSYSIK